jgi:hypothetical protein
MDIDRILQIFNECHVQYLLIGGMNFALRHRPYTTYDIDLWIEDTELNRSACERALATLGAEWGRSDEDWGPTREKKSGWLESQGVFSLNCPFGSVDIFRAVKGLGDWATSHAQSLAESTKEGTPYRGLSDTDMLRCQLALEASQQKIERIRVLQERLGQAES